jgi:flavin-dependent dehydrogenase
MSISATLTLSEAAGRSWDVLVVGAGPAGAVTARELARGGASVLLVDRAAFPRRKVCGGCLSARGLHALERIGLGDLPSQLGAIPLVEAHLFAGGRCAPIRWPGGIAISREALDAGLIATSVEAGAHFLPETSAQLLPPSSDVREVSMHQADRAVNVAARIVIAADGLGGSLTARSAEAPDVVASGSRVGAGCALDASADSCPPGVVRMVCGRGGYVGLVRLEDGRLNCAAALDREAVRRLGGPGRVAEAVLNEARAPVPAGLAEADWRGTPALTRRRQQPWAERLFLAGDAAGYYEPFTGEGMAWAIESAVALAPLAKRAVQSWDPALGQAWSRIHRGIVRSRLLRSAAFLLRRPRLAAAAVRVLSYCPSVSSTVALRFSARRDFNRSPAMS